MPVTVSQGYSNMSKYLVAPLLPDHLKTYSLKDRKSKVAVGHFAHPWPPDGTFSDFIDGLPDILGGRHFREFLTAWKGARQRNKAMLVGMGAHIIKVGLSPVLIDLMQRGWISALALNGAGIIHDFEVALAGVTSEDVADQIRDGEFGMAQETGAALNEAAVFAREQGLGLGEAVGKRLAESSFPHRRLSLLATAYELNIPVTVHVALGTDTIHFFPQVSGEALGAASLRDFFLFCGLVKGLDGGGIYLNAGSAVVLPEVFLKAVSYVRNRGNRLDDFSTAVCDFLRLYRPEQNVVIRPLGKSGRGYYFVGQHELLIPLLAAALKSS
jgi:hypothetical protein